MAQGLRYGTLLVGILEVATVVITPFLAYRFNTKQLISLCVNILLSSILILGAALVH